MTGVLLETAPTRTYMMETVVFRKSSALVAGLVIAVFAARGPAEPPAVTFGDSVKGELTPMNKVTTAYTYTAQLVTGRTVGYNTSYNITYSTEYSVALRAGQNVTVAAATVGKDRGVLVVLLDPTGKAVDGTEVRPGALEVTFDDVSATGRYRIIVASDRIGDFTLRLTGAPDRDLEIRALEQRIAWLKRDINETEVKLKTIKPK